MIHPISGVSFCNNYSSRQNFKGNLDPAILSHSSASKSLSDMAAEIAGRFKEVKMPSKIANGIEESSGLRMLDSRNILNPETGIATHILPDGTPITYSIGKGADTIQKVSKDVDLPKDEDLQIVDSRNLYNPQTGTATHILPDGTPITYEASLGKTVPDTTPEIGLPESVAPKSGLQVLDANNIIDPSSNTLLHNTGDGTVIPISLDSPTTPIDLPDNAGLLDDGTSHLEDIMDLF